MQVAIIAGGLGTRLGSLTKNQPKSMINILGKPFIEHQLDFLKKGHVKDIILCLGHKSESIREYCGDGGKFGVNIEYSCENRPMDTAGALKLAEPLLEDYFFTLYGDSYIFADFSNMQKQLQNTEKLAMMSVYKNQGRYDKSNTAIENGMVNYYGKERTDGLIHIEYGVNYFCKKVLDMIPPDEPYSMGMLFTSLIKCNELLAYTVRRRFYEIGSINGLAGFTDYVRRLK